MFKKQHLELIEEWVFRLSEATNVSFVVSFIASQNT